MNDDSAFDIIITKDEEHHGVIDYETTKHYVFFDIKNSDCPEVRLLILMWKLYYQRTRFSIFKEMYFGNIKLDSPILINKRNIVKMTKPTIEKAPKRKTRRV